MQGSMQQASMGELFSAWFAMLGRHASVCALAGGLLLAVGMLLDISMSEALGQLLNSIVGFFVQYHLVEYVLARDFGLRTGGRHYGAALGSALLATVGMLGGMILLILPGLYLAARWSLSTPLVVGEGYGATAALGESWRRTEASAWPIVSCFVVVGLLLALGIGGLVGVVLVPAAEGSLLESFAGNLFGGFFSVVLSLLACAFYGVLSQPQGKLDDVFS